MGFGVWGVGLGVLGVGGVEFGVCVVLGVTRWSCYGVLGRVKG